MVLDVAALVVDVVALVLDVVVAVAVPAAVVGVHAGQEDQEPAVLVAAAVEVLPAPVVRPPEEEARHRQDVEHARLAHLPGHEVRLRLLHDPVRLQELVRREQGDEGDQAGPRRRLDLNFDDEDDFEGPNG